MRNKLVGLVARLRPKRASPSKIRPQTVEKRNIAKILEAFVSSEAVKKKCAAYEDSKSKISRMGGTIKVSGVGSYERSGISSAARVDISVPVPTEDSTLDMSLSQKVNGMGFDLVLKKEKDGSIYEIRGCENDIRRIDSIAERALRTVELVENGQSKPLKLRSAEELIKDRQKFVETECISAKTKLESAGGSLKADVSEYGTEILMSLPVKTKDRTIDENLCDYIGMLGLDISYMRKEDGPEYLVRCTTKDAGEAEALSRKLISAADIISEAEPKKAERKLQAEEREERRKQSMRGMDLKEITAEIGKVLGSGTCRSEGRARTIISRSIRQAS